jgi:hypothetical protein
MVDACRMQDRPCFKISRFSTKYSLLLYHTVA